MTKKEDTYDPYMIDTDVIKKQKASLKMGSSGLVCPKRNDSIGKTCKVCDYIQTQIYAKRYPKEHPASKWAGQKSAKSSFFLNVVFPSNKDKVIILELGSTVGSQILNGIEKKGWIDIAHPKKGMGREMDIDKSIKDNHPFYSASPDLNKADWGVSKSVLASRYNLTNIVSMIQNNELNDDNHFKISKLKEGEVLKFRILPPWDDGKGNKQIMSVLFRHWGVTQDQIDGKEGINWQEIEVDVTADTKHSMGVDEALDKGGLGNSPDEEPTTERLKCFGDKRYFSETDADCIDCPDFVECKTEVES